MPVEILAKSDLSVLNLCAKHLARDRGESAESWRFPLIEPHPNTSAGTMSRNAVTFVHDGHRRPATAVSVIGTFATLYQPLALEPVRWQGEETGYRALTVLVPEGELHTYRLVVDGEIQLDALNPLRVQLDDGSVWSRFFTDNCRRPVSFESWQYVLLTRLVSHILPFRSVAGQTFLDRYYFAADRSSRDLDLARAYRLDDEVGSVTYIDHLLAREEAHRLIDYRICLSIIDRLLRSRNPYLEPAEMPRDMYVELYEQMATDQVAGWDYRRYGSPRFFLQLLRRHAYTGAFCHPRYGGNAGGAGWAFLAERYKDEAGKSLFDWRPAVEAPLGSSRSYGG